jgi:omega-6 fatty acid desaturase (delta-12 desaturase)
MLINAATESDVAFATALPLPPETENRIKKLAAHCQKYKGAVVHRSVTQLAVTSSLFFAACALMFFNVMHGYGLWNLLLLPPAAGLLVRLFIIQHDCGHGSYFKTRKLNDMVGRLISTLTLMPYAFWMKCHNIHHSSSGNLHKRGVGAIDTLTIREYMALPARQKLTYRLYRNPLVLLILGTPVHSLFLQRYPSCYPSLYIDNYRDLPRSEYWKSIIGLDVAIVAIYGSLIALLGAKAVFLVYLPLLVLTCWIGGWLFFIQHQFEDAYWETHDKWDYQEAAVLGSSYYALPRVVQWFTGNIGLHHIHHLCSLIPNYRLQECLDANEDLQALNRMSFRDSLKCLTWRLWDEDQKKMVGFDALKGRLVSV